MKFCSLYSGSTGNCLFVSSEKAKILIDAGVSVKKIEQALISLGENISDINAILVTHEHSDHIKSIGSISKKYNIPVYANEETWAAMPEQLNKINLLNKKIFIPNKTFDIIDLKINDKELDKAPVTKRYPKEMYYRILASYYLPKKVDKILYLDPDLVVINKIDKLYKTDLDNYYFAAASHIWGILQIFNRIRLRMKNDDIYINSGVMLMNIKLLRREQNREDVYKFIKRNKNNLMLPDQDVISGLYANKILPLDPYVYNMTEKLMKQTYFMPHISERWIKDNSVIISPIITFYSF